MGPFLFLPSEVHSTLAMLASPCFEYGSTPKLRPDEIDALSIRAGAPLGRDQNRYRRSRDRSPTTAKRTAGHSTTDNFPVAFAIREDASFYETMSAVVDNAVATWSRGPLNARDESWTQQARPPAGSRLVGRRGANICASSAQRGFTFCYIHINAGVAKTRPAKNAFAAASCRHVFHGFRWALRH